MPTEIDLYSDVLTKPTPEMRIAPQSERALQAAREVFRA